jgi:hypothetical protein
MAEYLTRHPTGIRAAVGEVAKEMGLALPGSGLDDLAQEITQMFLDFVAAGLEDVVAMYAFHTPVRPGERRSAHFHGYLRLRVKACVPVALRNEPPGHRN